MTREELNNITPEDIAAMHDAVLNFHGKSVNFEQLKKFNELAEIAQTLLDDSVSILRITISPAEPDERNGQVYVDVRKPVFFDEVVTSKLARMMQLSDIYTLAVPDKFIRMTFGVCDIRE